MSKKKETEVERKVRLAYEKADRYVASFGIPKGTEHLLGTALEIPCALAMADVMNWAGVRGLDVNRIINVARKIHIAEFGKPTLGKPLGDDDDNDSD